MEYGVYRRKPRTITALFKKYNNKRKNEFLEYFQYALEERYGLPIETLAQIAFGETPDITKAC